MKKEKENWIKEFDEKLPEIHGRRLPLKIKDYIRQERLKAEKELKQKLLYEIPSNIETNPEIWAGFEKCRKKVLELLK